MGRFVLLLLILWLTAVSACAYDLQAQARAYGMDGLESAIDEDAAELMPEISPTAPGQLDDGILTILQSAAPRVGGILRDTLKTAVSILAVLILCALASQLENKLSQNTVLLAGAVAITLLSVSNLNAMIGLGKETLQELQSFSMLLLPVMSSALAAGGGVTTAATLYATTAFLSSLFMKLFTVFLVPLLYAYLAISAGNTVVGNQSLKRLCDLAKWIITNTLKLSVLLFSGYLSLSGVISGAGDEATVKAAKLAVSTAVPVVGGMISDASETVLAGAQILKNAGGIFGMLAILAICLTPLLRLGAQHLVLKATAALGAIVGEKRLVELVESVSDAMGYILGMTGAAAFMMLISCVCYVKSVTL